MVSQLINEGESAEHRGKVIGMGRRVVKPVSRRRPCHPIRYMSIVYSAREVDLMMTNASRIVAYLISRLHAGMRRRSQRRLVH